MTDAPNIVVVVLDTMRRDVLRAYGGAARSPYLDSLAHDGVVYPNCVASSPWTAPSHASLFSGLLPSVHGVHETWDKKIVEVFGSMKAVQAEPLAAYLADRGYYTACYSANANIAPGSGFERGFSAFTLMNVTNPDEETKQAIEMARKYGKTKGEVAVNMLKQGKVADLAHLFWEDQKLRREHRRRNFPSVKGGDGIATSIAGLRLEQPFFLFVNLLEMHEPYTSGELGGEPRPITDLFGQRVIAGELMTAIRKKYAGQVSVVDAFLGRILAWLKKAGVYEGSLVVVTSDHGQALKEAGVYGHGTFLFDEILEVPLLVKYPKNVRPSPAAGYQPLHRVQEVVKDALVGVHDGKSMSSSHAVSESYGIPFGLEGVSDVPDFESKRVRYDRPRKAVYSRGLKLVLEGKEGKIEEFSGAGGLLRPEDHRDEVADMVDILARIGDREFALPSRG